MGLYRARLINSNLFMVGYYDCRYTDGESNKAHFITYESLEWEIDPTTIAVKIGERNLFMSLDIKTGKGGDIIKRKPNLSNDCVLAWNDEILSCCILVIEKSLNVWDIIDFTNFDINELEIIGIFKGEEKQ